MSQSSAVRVALVLVGAITIGACAASGIEEPSDAPSGGTAATETPMPVDAGPIVPMVAAGDGTSFVLTSDGTVYGWGNQVNGRLGDGETANRSRTQAAPVLGLDQIRQIAIGAAHGLALRQDGTVYAWGANGSGRLGNGEDGGEAGVPFRVPGLSGVAAVAAGARFSLALARDGRVFGWGENVAGQLGTGDVEQRESPTLVQGLDDVALIAAGGQQAFAVRRDGAVFAWGNNQDGQLGLGAEPDGDAANVLRPRRITAFDALRVRAIAVGSFHAVVILGDGSIRTFGASNLGQAGSDSSEDHFATYPAPIEPAGLSGVTAAAAGDMHTLLLGSDGVVRALGHAGDGRLGDGSNGRSQSSSLPSSVDAADVVGLAAGWRHSLVLTKDGVVGCMGSNFLGQCGLSQGFTEVITPTAVPGVRAFPPR